MSLTGNTPCEGLGCTLPEWRQENGFRLAPVAPGSIPMQRLSAPERTREELRALMNGELGTAAGRSDLVRLALRLIVEEALEGEVATRWAASDARGDGGKTGYRNGYRMGKVKTAEGAVDFRRRRCARRRSRLSRAFGRRSQAARKRSRTSRSNFMRAGCRRAPSRTPSPTRRAEGFCRGRR